MGWRDVLVPVVERYKERKVRLYFRGDAAFASPNIYEYLEAEGILSCFQDGACSATIGAEIGSHLENVG